MSLWRNILRRPRPVNFEAITDADDCAIASRFLIRVVDALDAGDFTSLATDENFKDRALVVASRLHNVRRRIAARI